MSEIEKLLKEKGYKITSARLALLKIFYTQTRPLTAEEIFTKIKRQEKKIDLATVYRNLFSLLKDEILRKIDLKKDSDFFELNIDHHHHIICTRCDLIENFKNEEMEKLLNKIVKKSHYFDKTLNHSFELFGLCKKCSN